MAPLACRTGSRRRHQDAESKERTTSKMVTGAGRAVDRSRMGHTCCLERDGSTPCPPSPGGNVAQNTVRL